MNAYVAEIGEIVRAQRRDEEFVEEISERLSKVTKELLGQRKWIRWFPYLRTIASSIYYTNTIVAGNQTLGEEYIHLFESDGLRRIVPSIPTRVYFVLLHSVFPLLSNFLIQKSENLLTHPSTETFLGIPIPPNSKARKSFIDLFFWLRTSAFPQLQRFHVALFYITGAYYSISRRVTGIRFLSASPQTDIPALKVYRILGYITILQLIVSTLLGLYSLLENNRNIKKDQKNSNNGVGDEESRNNQSLKHKWFICSICLEQKDPSTLFCGHLYCWNCIQEHSASSVAGSSPSRCPQCRLEFEPRDVTPLLNL